LARLPLFACFFLSGAASLVAEVVWTRLLILGVGGTRPAVSLTLAGFMGGLALGSALAGPWADRVRRPMRLYAILELAIGACALLVPTALEWIGERHAAAYRAGLSPEALGAVRFGLSFACLALPAGLMGATFPVMLRAAAPSSERVGATTSLLYGVNTLGGVVGTLSAAFVLMPAFGIRASLWAAALCNGVAALIAWTLPTSASAPAPVPSEEAPGGRGSGMLLGAAAALGFASLAYEVLWSRILVLLLGGSVYAFAMMLAAFLCGIAAGGLIVARWADRWTRPARAVGLAQAATALLMFAWFAMMTIPFGLAVRIREAWPDSFWLYNLARFGLVLALLAAVTVPMGMSFPLLVRMAHRRFPRLGREAGGIYAANTAGAVAGALVGGLVLLPSLGLHGAICALAGLSLLLGLGFWLSELSTWRGRAGAAVAAAALTAAVAAAFPTPDASLLHSGVFLHERPGGEAASERLLGEWSGLNAEVAVVQMGDERVLRINGKADAGTGDERTQFLLGHLPMLLHPAPRSVLVVGFGVGGSLAAVTTYPEPGRIVCVEIEPAVVEAGRRFFAERYRRPLEDPRVRLVVEDARLFCRASDETFDVIISEPSNPWLTGVSNLFTLEFFRMLRERLAPGGIVCIWLPLHELVASEARAAYRTAQEVFADLTVWETGQMDVLMIARRDGPLRVPYDRWARELGENPRLRSDLERVALKGWRDLAERALIDERRLKPYVQGAPINTDDRPLLEFEIPRRPRPSGRGDEVLLSLMDLYRTIPAGEAHLLLPFEPYGAPGRPEHFGAVELDVRRGGRPPDVHFAGLARVFTRFQVPDTPEVFLLDVSAYVIRGSGAGVPFEIRAYRLPPGDPLRPPEAAEGVGPAVVSGHEALEGIFPASRGVIAMASWQCPEKETAFELRWGPVSEVPPIDWIARLEIECRHEEP
jgi:spermidine synthase